MHTTMKSPFAFHEGKALLRLASTYPRIIDILLECLQNCLDKNATTVMITVNQKSRNISVRDDGDGVTKAEFEEALTSCADSIKKKGKLGRFGLGLISPLGKCVRFTFTSTPKRDSRSYLEWSFVTEDLLSQNEIDGIPMRPRPDLQFSRNSTSGSKGLTLVPWRTEVTLERFTPDQQINRVTIDSLRDALLDRFGSNMRRNKAVVVISITDEAGNKRTEEVRAKEFEGRKLAEVEWSDKDSGRTNFKLFLAKKTDKGVRKGKVLFGEIGDDFRFDFTTFNRSLPEVCQLSPELVDALKSGMFEGEILNNRVKLHASRRSFEANDALLEFCAVLEKWYELHGSKHFQEATEQKQEEKWQRLGQCSMRVLAELIKNPAFVNLLKTVNSFKLGSIGQGHVKHEGKLSPDTSVSSVKASKTSSSEDGGTGSGEKGEPETEIKAHHPMTVVGPKGQRRVIVRNNSLGLQLVHEAMEGSDKLWDLDRNTGSFRINVLHPLWSQCEDHSDKTVMRFQEYLLIQALTLHSTQEEWAPYAQLVLDEINAPYVFMLIHGDAIAGRQLGRPKKLTTQ